MKDDPGIGSWCCTYNSGMSVGRCERRRRVGSTLAQRRADGICSGVPDTSFASGCGCARKRCQDAFLSLLERCQKRKAVSDKMENPSVDRAPEGELVGCSLAHYWWASKRRHRGSST